MPGQLDLYVAAEEAAAELAAAASAAQVPAPFGAGTTPPPTGPTAGGELADTRPVIPAEEVE